MSQYLIMPINNAIITATFKSKGYKDDFKVWHYGVDMYSNTDRVVFASGVGEVVCAGHDQTVGNTVCVIYKDAAYGNSTKTVAVRYFHLNDIRVKVGQKTNKDTVLGHWGNTGKYVRGAHLHIEIDNDYKGWKGIPGLTPNPTQDQLNRGVAKYYRGSDTMLDPASLLHPYSKDKQNIRWSTSTYNGHPYAEKHGFSSVSTLAPKPKTDWEKKYNDEVKAHEKTKAELKKTQEENETLRKELRTQNEKVTSLERELEAANGNIGLMKEEIDRLNEKIEALEKDNSEKDSLISDFTQAANALFNSK